MGTVREALKWVRVCEPCGGNGCVEDDEELLWVCTACGGSGEAEGAGEWIGLLSRRSRL